MAGSLVWQRALANASTKIPNLESLLDKIARSPTEILSEDGHVLYTVTAENRQPIRIEDVPLVVRQATLAAEDKRFFDHSGVDAWAIGRALFTSAKEGRAAQGASTITMQLAKRLYTSPQKTFGRKIEDMALAVMIERTKTKQQILELYLNQVFYGSGAYGIQSAADVYFGKELDKLTIAEAALLSRCVRRPSDENPYADPEKAIANRNVVLNTMREEGMITEQQYQSALKEKLKLRRTRSRILTGEKTAPYFVDYVLDVVRRELPNIDVTAGGYRIETTLNTVMQEDAEQAVRKLVNDYRKSRVTTGAFVLMNREGQILAMVGGVDYKRNQFNMVSQGRRQPGSSFKPFVYAAALERHDIRPTDSISNARFVYRTGGGKVWSPDNSSGRYGGSVSIRTAIASSINVPAVRVMDKVGPSIAVEFAHDVFGFQSELAPVLSLVLGAGAVSPLEMAQGYSVFMLNGDRATPYGIKRIIGPNGELVKSFEPRIASGVLSSSTAQLMDGFLRAVVTSGTARRASSVINARGKTGTTSDNLDAWFCGYTDELLGIGWIANEVPSKSKDRKWDYLKMSSTVFGGTVTVRMWTDIMTTAQKKIGEKPRKIADREYGVSTKDDDKSEPKDTTPTDVTPDEDYGKRPEDWVLPPIEKPEPEQEPVDNPPTNGGGGDEGTGDTTGGGT